jgi:hypothetical protein
MDELPDSSAHFMAISPPHNVRKADYDQDLTLEEYKALLRNII